MIFGIGTDICDVRRIRASLERHGERFAAKVLAPGELATWQARSSRWPERGVRYLAMPMTWRSCEIAKLPSGAPIVVLHGALKDWFDARGLQAQISLSDETDYAVSFCVVESCGGAQETLPTHGDDAARPAGDARRTAT